VFVVVSPWSRKTESTLVAAVGPLPSESHIRWAAPLSDWVMAACIAAEGVCDPVSSRTARATGIFMVDHATPPSYSPKVTVPPAGLLRATPA
jgi:hypothetical protein